MGLAHKIVEWAELEVTRERTRTLGSLANFLSGALPRELTATYPVIHTEKEESSRVSVVVV